jgi:uncharacterized membrane protein YkoI
MMALVLFAAALTLSDLPPAARATVDKHIRAAAISKIDKETENGKTVFDVEGTVNGKHVEVTVAEDGALLSTERGVSFDSLPRAVRKAAEKYFGSRADLKASKETESGKIAYEIEGKQVTIKLDKSGKVLEEEKH